jgi:hypothetical protein
MLTQPQEVAINAAYQVLQYLIQLHQENQNINEFLNFDEIGSAMDAIEGNFPELFTSDGA